MNVAPISFKGLDYRDVSVEDREHFIKKDLKKLQELGTKYDIKLTSTCTDIPGFAAIDINVRPLKKNMNLIKRLFSCPSVSSTFQGGCQQQIKSSIVKYVEDAISDLGKKMHK